jgi:hypothetical protein
MGADRWSGFLALNSLGSCSPTLNSGLCSSVDGFDLLDRIGVVYIVMVLKVVCLFGCVFTTILTVVLFIPSCGSFA